MGERSVLPPGRLWPSVAAMGQLNDVIGRRPQKHLQILSGLSLELTPTCTEYQGPFKWGLGDADEDEERGEVAF